MRPALNLSIRAFAALAVGLTAAAAARAQNNNEQLPAPGQQQGRNVNGLSFTYAPFATPWNNGGLATPWGVQYGAIVQPAASYWEQDEIARQQAYSQRFYEKQDYELRRLALRRAQIEQMLYERAHLPTPEQLREESRLQRLTRARNTPPLEEIASARALNELLNSVQRTSNYGEASPGLTVAIDPETLQHINVTTTEDARGSNELFRPNTFNDWPAALTGERYAAEKEALRRAVNDMTAAQKAGRVDEAKAAQARRIVEDIRQKLYDDRFALAFGTYTKATEFLSKVEDAVGVLARPGAGKYLDGTYAAKGRTVAELTDYMTSKGLKFAPASAGSEPYYASLYNQLASYEIALSKKASQMNSPGRVSASMASTGGK